MEETESLPGTCLAPRPPLLEEDLSPSSALGDELQKYSRFWKCSESQLLTVNYPPVSHVIAFFAFSFLLHLPGSAPLSLLLPCDESLSLASLPLLDS